MKTTQSPLSGGVKMLGLRPNRWDFLAFPLIFGLLILMGQGARETLAPITSLDHSAISLDPINLPDYALRTVLRMFAAMLASLIFTFTYGTLAAKSRRLELVLVPMLDILQSVPVLGYISLTVVFFLSLFPGRVVGAEAAAIFAIFTSQAWNMAFSFYQSLRTVPRDLDDAASSFRFSGWQRFWKLETPFAMPGLIWNMMVSMSGGWFFVVASEAVSVGDKTFTLPGIGSYLATAIATENLTAIGWVILTMLLVILLYDQLLFRPLVAWADKFRNELVVTEAAPHSWFLALLSRSRLVAAFGRILGHIGGAILQLRLPVPGFSTPLPASNRPPSVLLDRLWFLAVLAGACTSTWQIIRFIGTEIGLADIRLALILGLITLLRVFALILLASLIWVPLGVMIGLRPRLAGFIQPIAQFLAAFPANLLFPIFVVGILRWHGNPDFWLSPLMILGTQWYILFNVVAGAAAFPSDFREAARNFRISGGQWWRRVMLPGIFPYFVTGAITASGGAWNASIVAEAVSWGPTRLEAHGLGAYIADMTLAGDYPRIMLGICVMSIYVVVFNRILWRPLYHYAENRLRLD